MPYWLAPRGAAGDTSYIQRFDPRFWHVNFPRPMMASIVTTAPDALRFDAVFYHKNALAGLIWDSEDTHDHPLLGYETQRDYRHGTLSFRWRSGGVRALDALHGPTLTIEGRDAGGQARSWYVRLWNYAHGTPQDARITLNFGDLAGGFLHPVEADPVHAAHIDRMFISLVPSEYDGSDAPLSAPAEGWAELSEIRYDGAHAALEIGDVLVPPHGLSMATAYDDSANLTPERILRGIRGLGYRGAINHYVGMSHYMRLSEEALTATADGGALNAPCERWHTDFAARAKAIGFEMIFSLSYELFDAYCPPAWKQRAENGDPAQTGWVPPSALLSPANDAAMGYLQSVARAFAAILQDAGQPVRFQIGEPWWWVMGDGRICLYDDAARTALGEALVPIADVRAPMDAAQRAMLDAAGVVLANSTAAIADAVRAQEADAELLLLVYLPTVLDAAAPDLVRANVPAGWAKPAFDVLQLEDYDWVTEGRAADRKRGLALMESRLGYAVAEQHYLSGFVLRPDDSGQWAQISQAAENARARGTASSFIWAWPQVVRDGFTYFNLDDGEQDMRAFDDVDFPLALGLQSAARAEFSTSIVTTASGHERRNSKWADARLGFDAGPALGSEDDLAVLLAFFRARRGAAKGFRFRDPFDHSSGGMTSDPAPLDQPIGTGDGVQSVFALVKHYGGDEPQVRRITRPVADSVRVAVGGVEVQDWTLETYGKIAFAEAPPSGAAITAGYLFDVPVRFETDRLDIGSASFAAGEIPAIPMIEIREDM